MKNWYDWVETNKNTLGVQLTAGSSVSIPLTLDFTKLVNGAWEELFANATVGTAYQDGVQTSQLAISNAAVSMRSTHATVHAFFEEVMLRRQPDPRRLGPNHDFLHTLHDEAANRHGLQGTSASNSTVGILGLPPGSNGKDNVELVAGRLGISLVHDDTQVPVANAVRIAPVNVAGSGLPDRAQAGIASLLDRMSSTPVVPIELDLQTAPPVTYDSGSYALSFAVLNGTGPLKWSILYLPNGLTYDANSGAISGSPVGPGSYHAAITVSDSSNPPRSSVFRLQISVLPARLPDGFANKPYTAQVHAPGGPFTWSLMPGSSLPAGISLDANTGKLSGIPTATTESPLSIDFKGVSGARTVHRKLSLTIANFGSASLPNGLVGVAYSAATLPPKGKSPNRWNIASGRLTQGLTLNSNNGAISGIPEQVGTGNFRVQMKDASPDWSLVHRYTLWNAQDRTAITKSGR
jgi:hypothetical protein